MKKNVFQNQKEDKGKLINDFFENEQEKQTDGEKSEEISFATFRISRTTTFKDLKNLAGDFWVFFLVIN